MKPTAFIILILTLPLAFNSYARAFNKNVLSVNCNTPEFGKFEVHIEKTDLQNRDKYKESKVLFWGGDEMYIPKKIVTASSESNFYLNKVTPFNYS
jgi:hypothetical protein